MKYDTPNQRPRDPVKAALVGALGGLAGTWAMNQFQRWWTLTFNGHASPSAAGKHDARDWQEKNEGQNANEIVGALGARALLGRRPTSRERSMAAVAVHFSFGAAMGAAYGVLVESEGSGMAAGAGWGAAVWLAADEIAMPLMGLSRTDVDYPLESHLQSLAAHLVYGMVVAMVSSFGEGPSGAHAIRKAVLLRKALA
jgi:hypothetical protein